MAKQFLSCSMGYQHAFVNMEPSCRLGANGEVFVVLNFSLEPLHLAIGLILLLISSCDLHLSGACLQSICRAFVGQ